MPEGFSHTTKTNTALDQAVKKKKKVRVKRKPPKEGASSSPALIRADGPDRISAADKKKIAREQARNAQIQAAKDKVARGLTFEEAKGLPDRFKKRSGIGHALGHAALGLGESLFGPILESGIAGANAQRGRNTSGWGTSQSRAIGRSVESPGAQGLGGGAKAYLDWWAGSPDLTQYLTGQPYRPGGAALGAAMLFGGLGQPGAGVEHAAEEALSRPLANLLQDAASKMHFRRVYSKRLGQWVTTSERDYGSRFGRTVARGGEHIRAKLPDRTPIISTGDEKIGEEILRRTKQTDAKLMSSEAKAVSDIGKGLKRDEQYALILIADGAPPERQIAYHMGEAQAAKAKGNDLSAAAHLAHAAMLERAAKYVVRADDGKLYIADGARQKLKDIERLWETAQVKREDIYTGLRLLDPDQIEARKQSTGRLVMGAKRVNQRGKDFYDLQRSGDRSRIRQDLLDLEIPEEQVDNMLAVHDPMALNLWKQNIKKSKREYQMLKKAVAAGEDLTDAQRARYAELRRMKQIGFEKAIPKDLYYARLGAIWRGFPESVRARLNYEDLMQMALMGGQTQTAREAADVIGMLDQLEGQGRNADFMDLLDFKRIEEEPPRGTGPNGEFVYGKDSLAARPGYGRQRSPEEQAALDAADEAEEQAYLLDKLREDLGLDRRRAQGPPKGFVDDVVQAEVKAARKWALSGLKKVNYLPPGYKSPKKFGELVSELYDRAVEGLKYAKNWYRDSGAAILRHSGGDLKKADELAALTAIYSPQQSVVPNIGLALRAHEEFVRTRNITLGQPWQQARALEAVQGKDWRAAYKADDAIKIRNFYGNLLKHIDPELMRERGYTGREVTSDGWMGAAFHLGANTDSVYINPQQHRMIERVTQQIADALGIEPEEAQAAIWTSIKASNDRYLNKLPREQALERAGVHFESGLTRSEHQVRIAFEAASDNIPEYATWGDEVQQAFLEANAIAVRDAFHKNGLYAHLTDYGIGTWIDEPGNVHTNPAVALEVGIGNRPAGDYSLLEGQKELYDALAAVIGRGLKQDGAGWLRPFVPKTPTKTTYYRIGGDFTAEQRGAFAAEVGDIGYVTQTNDGIMFVRYDPESVLDGGESPNEIGARIAQAGKTHLGDDVTLEAGIHRGGYLGGEEEYGLALELGGRTLDSGGRPDLLRGLDSDLASATAAVRRDFIADPERAASAYSRGARAETAGAPGDLSAGSRGLARGADAEPLERRQAPSYRSDVPGVFGPTVGVAYARAKQGTPRPMLEAFERDHPDAANFLRHIAISDEIVRAGGSSVVVWHELSHYAEHAFRKHGLGKYAKAFAKIAQNEDGSRDLEKWALGFEKLLLDPEAVNLPAEEKEALTRFAGYAYDMWQQAKQIYSRTMLPEIGANGAPRNLTHEQRLEADELQKEVQGLFEALATYEAKGKEMYLVGEEGYDAGRFYLAMKRGLPVSWRKPINRARVYKRTVEALLSGNRKNALGMRGMDISTQKQWLGWLKELGYFVGNATDAIGESGVKAARLGSIAKAKELITPFTTELPMRADDLAIRMNPEEALTDEERKRFKLIMDLLDDMEFGRKVNYKEFERADLKTIENLREQLFPSQIGDQTTEQLVKDLHAEMGSESAAGKIASIPGIRFVSRETLERLGMTASTDSLALQRQTWNFENAGKTIDFVNNFIKLQMLQLNPAYYTMNFAGNSAMGLMQQGMFFFPNVVRAGRINQNLGEIYGRLIDDLVGAGVLSTSQFQGIDRAHILGTHVNNFATALVDRLPRRAAWYYEAHKLGFSDDIRIKQLLDAATQGDEEATRVVDYITQGAKNALVDYDRLNPFEKKYVQRVIFFYPWIKGATRWTLRFPLEHPIQAITYAGLFGMQQYFADQQLGDRPWYQAMAVPVGYPYVDGETVGWHWVKASRGGADYPVLFNPKQLITFSTPIEVGESLYGFVSGAKNHQPLAETLTPFPAALLTALSGKRSFDDQEVPPTLGTLGNELVSFPPIVDKILSFWADSEKSNRLYPRNAWDKALSSALGSLAPTPYNREKGEWIAKGQRGRTPEQESREMVQEYKDAFGSNPPPAIKQAYDSKAKWKYDLLKAHEKESDLTDEQLALLKYTFLLKYKPQFESARQKVLDGIANGEASAINAWAERELGWNDLEDITRSKNEKKKAQEGHVVSATG